MRNFFQELRRRNVVKAAVSYVVVSWAIIQVADILFPILEISSTSLRYILYFLIVAFPFWLTFAYMFEWTPTGFKKTEDVAPEASVTVQTGRTLNKFIIATLSIVVVLLLVDRFFNLTGTDLTASPPESIAVLPFENRSDNTTDEYFADGLTDEIIEHLSILGELHVINRQSIIGYRGKELSYKNIGHDLNVANVLTGSVRRSGDQIKISATLIECSSNKYLWGATFQRTSKDIIAIQSEIARSIAHVLKVHINESEDLKLEHQFTQNPTAHDYYIKGRTLYYQYQNATNDRAIEHFKMAIALDPQYALAWAGLGDAYSQMHGRFSRGVAWIDSSIVAGKKAIALDSTLSDGYKAVANALNYIQQYDTAFFYLQKAVQLNPTNAQAVGNLGTSYFNRGDLPMALYWEKKAAGLNPKNAVPFQIIGWTYRLLGDYPQAESWLKKSLELNSTSFWDTYEMLAYCYLSQGRKQEALEVIDAMLENVPGDSRTYETAGLIAHFAGETKQAEGYFLKSIDTNPSYQDDRNTVSPIGLGQILQDKGKKVEAEIYLTHALQMNLDEIEDGASDGDLRFYVAGIYSIMGQRDKVVEWLDKAIQINWIDYAQVEYGPWFVEYRNDPDVESRMKTLRNKMQVMRQKSQDQ